MGVIKADTRSLGYSSCGGGPRLESEAWASGFRRALQDVESGDVRVRAGFPETFLSCSAFVGGLAECKVLGSCGDRQGRSFKGG